MNDYTDHAAVALELGNGLERSRGLSVLADRERIAHDLNDHVIRRIFAVGLDLQGTIARSRSSEITARLNRSIADLQTVIEEIGTTVFELHATGKRRVGFRRRIQDAVADLTENGDIATTMRMSGPMSVIGDDLAGHAESVILEATNNAIHHSGATQLTVAVTVADELDVTITDDGSCISADDQCHSGLAHMASRAQQIGGACRLTTPPGGGTAVNWTAPFAHGP
jgi:two-component system, NarL family, sensor histidine kinase DevS